MKTTPRILLAALSLLALPAAAATAAQDGQTKRKNR